MKKIFRMALVFALAGATLMYTGCTKDYDEEINRINTNVTNLQNDLSSKLSDLEGRVSTLSSSVSSLDAAYKAADAALQKAIDANAGNITNLQKDLKDLKDKTASDIDGLKGRVAALEEATKDLDKLATKDEVAATYATKEELDKAKAALEKKIEDDLAALKADVLKVTDDLQAQVNAIKADVEDLKENKADKADVEKIAADLKAAQDRIEEVYEQLANELRSIVFYPDFYFAGIEATSFDFADFWALEPVYYYDGRTGKAADYSFTGDYILDNGDETLYIIKKNTPMYFDSIVDRDKNGNVIYYLVDWNTGEYLRDAKGNMVKGTANDAWDDAFPYYPYDFSQAQIGKAYYNLNPSSFAVPDAEGWRLEGRNVKYYVKGGEEEVTWNPVLVDITKDASGLAEVLYQVENPTYLFSSVLAAFPFIGEDWFYSWSPERIASSEYSEYMARGDWYLTAVKNWYLADSFEFNNVPTMRLVKTLDEGREIMSDWHAVASDEEIIHHLAFASTNDYETNYWYGDCGTFAPAVKDLYDWAPDAIANEASVPVKYNGGAVDLAELINIHAIEIYNYDFYWDDLETADEATEYTLAELSEKYPSFHYEFSLIPYTIGEITTGENYYGKIEGSKFTPCWVKSETNPVSIPIAEGSEDGVSAVGRMPVVLVTLVNDDNKQVYAYGYFKIIIVKDVKAPTYINISAGTVPYICNFFEIYTNWHEFSDFVLETLKMDYKQFVRTYEFDGVYVERGVVENGKVVKKLLPIDLSNNPNPQPGDIFSVKFTDYLTPTRSVVKNWGYAQYFEDESGSGINNAFWWNVNPYEKNGGLGENGSATLHYHFVNADGHEVYIKLTATVAAKPALKWVTNKIANEWWGDINGEASNTVRLNVPVSVADENSPVHGGDVLKFQRDLNRFFQGYKPNLGKDTGDIYKYYYTNPATPGYPASEVATTTLFYFADEQPVINKTQLYTNWWDGSDILYVAYKSNNQVVYDDISAMFFMEEGSVLVPRIKTDGSTIIATIENNAVLKYSTSKTAKEFLNLYPHTATDQAEMLFCNILAKNYYGECLIPLEDGKFYARFLRPLTVNSKPQDTSEESAVDGDCVEIFKFFNEIIDWNNQRVLVEEYVDDVDENGKPIKVWTGYYVPNVIKTVDQYVYYRFSKMRIALKDATRNNYDLDAADPSNKWAKVSSVTPDAKLSIGKIRADGTFNKLQEGGTYTVDISNYNNLKDLVINYRNDEATVETFSIRIPVEVDYAWGTLKLTFEVSIKKTAETQGQ